MRVQNVIFDLDGTLVDSAWGIEYSITRALAQCGYPTTDNDVESLIGPPVRQILSRLSAQTQPEALDRLESAFRESYDTKGWEKTLLRAHTTSTLKWLLSSGRQAFLFTNKPSVPTKRILELFDIRHFFADVVCRDSAPASFRSKADMIRSLTVFHNLAACRSLVVGDTSEDVHAAMESGMKAAVVPGYGPQPSDDTPHSFFRLNSLSDVATIIAHCEEAP